MFESSLLEALETVGLHFRTKVVVLDGFGQIL